MVVHFSGERAAAFITVQPESFPHSRPATKRKITERADHTAPVLHTQTLRGPPVGRHLTMPLEKSPLFGETLEEGKP